MVWAVVATVGWLAPAAPAAAAVTVGATGQPSGSEGQCVGGLEVQTTNYTASYTVPPEGGAITAWQTATGTIDSPGSLLTFALLRPGSTATSFTVVAADAETFPNSVPSNGVVSFPINPPIPAVGGDRLALYMPNQFTVPPACQFVGSPFEDILFGSAPPPAPGQSFVAPSAFNDGFALDVSATLDDDVDAGVSAGAGPAGATVGALAELTATVSNGGPATAPITITDSVPVGLTIRSATAGAGSCSVSGQAVNCSITGLAPGESAPVVILVTPTAPGQYTHIANVGVVGFTDPTTADNAAGATLTVAPAPSGGGGGSTARCIVPPLTGTSPAIARKVLQFVGCAIGKTASASSKKIRKGLVITTTPGAGKALAAGSAVKLTVSSGPPKKKRPRRGHRH